MKQLIRLTILFCTCAALALTALAGPEPLSCGKEMKHVVPAPPECDYTWTGFYICANPGYGWGTGDTHFPSLPDAVTFFDLVPYCPHPGPSGLIAYGHVCYN